MNPSPESNSSNLIGKVEMKEWAILDEDPQEVFTKMDIELDGLRADLVTEIRKRREHAGLRVI